MNSAIITPAALTTDRAEHARQESDRAERACPETGAGRLGHSLERLGLWRAADLGNEARRAGRPAEAALPTGCAVLDELLPDRGWPTADLVELLCDLNGIGELRLLLPALARLSHEQARWVAWIAPPHIPYAPALAACGVDISRILLIHPRTERDRLWAMEQALRSGTCSAVLGWPGAGIRQQDIRRLQWAAGQGNTLGLLFRPENAALEASPAPFRLVLRADASPLEPSRPDTGGRVKSAPRSEDAAQASSPLRVKLLKRRGGWATDFIALPLPLALPHEATLQGLQRQLSCWRGQPADAMRGPAQVRTPQAQSTQAQTAQAPTGQTQAGQTPAGEPGAARTEAPEVEPAGSGQFGALGGWARAMAETRLVIGRRRHGGQRAGTADGRPAPQPIRWGLHRPASQDAHGLRP